MSTSSDLIQVLAQDCKIFGLTQLYTTICIQGAVDASLNITNASMPIVNIRAANYAQFAAEQFKYVFAFAFTESQLFQSQNSGDAIILAHDTIQWNYNIGTGMADSPYNTMNQLATIASQHKPQSNKYGMPLGTFLKGQYGVVNAVNSIITQMPSKDPKSFGFYSAQIFKAEYDMYTVDGVTSRKEAMVYIFKYNTATGPMYMMIGTGITAPPV